MKHLLYTLVLLLAITLYTPPLAHAGDIPREGSPDSVAGLIERYSWYYGHDATLPLNIAYAESQFRNVPNFKYDGENGKYTAYGPFQLTRTFYKTFCGDPKERLIPKKNIECAVKVILTVENGANHWTESMRMNGRGWLYLPYKYNGEDTLGDV